MESPKNEPAFSTHAYWVRQDQGERQSHRNYIRCSRGNPKNFFNFIACRCIVRPIENPKKAPASLPHRWREILQTRPEIFSGFQFDVVYNEIHAPLAQLDRADAF
jgi:hypothetical protein